MKKTACLLLLGVYAQWAFAALSPAEKEVVAYIDANHKEAEALLEKSVNINSGTMNFAGVKAVGEQLIPYFEAIGFNAWFEDGAAFNRAGHLIAEHEGGSGPNILLIGHLDTVFEPDSPFQTFTRLDDKMARGPGIADMKGGNIILLQALRALHHSGHLSGMNVKVVMTGDEELSGEPLSASKQALVDAAKWADIALGFENGDGNPATANVSRRGSIGWTLTATGVPSHSSQVFQPKVGAGAIYELSRILHTFYLELRSEDLLTFNPGKIMGGTTVSHDVANNSGTTFGKDNVVAETAIATGDIRAVSAQQLARVKAKMTQIVSQHLPQTSATITFDEGYPPMGPSEGNKTLLTMYSAVSDDLGFGRVGPVNPLNAGAADVSFTAGYVQMALDGLGMGGTAGHTVNEAADMTTLSSQAKRAAVLMLRLQDK
ncbi:M20/M25/M40 family metallo-hydrolase [Alteromonas sp. CYL-A6]|uniref:M20/M25/M40 family metallo-hydrolase n=1 Tax=Alteromonas nitratireducens TaxID=3390813 RepID=UPI0034AC2935